MLPLTDIIAAYPPQVNRPTFYKRLLTEYVQYALLDSIFMHKEAAQLSFIGGTAIRLVYNSGRFSEDLDFDNFGLSFEEFQMLLEKVVVEMRQKGFSVEFRFVEKNAYHCYVKFPDVLQHAGLTQLKGEKLLVRVDAMDKKQLRTPAIHSMEKFTFARQIQVNTPEIILAQKIIAIKERHREKGRDFYDVRFLYARTTPDEKFIEEVTGMPVRDVYTAVCARCEMLNFKELALDVEPFIIEDGGAKRIETFLSFIKEKWQMG
jgi:predicted nucleotidyltransferase component of viral defense system